ncbi:hypothetical protein Q5752_004048 [Cryptotrichosporon argae]
MPWRSSTPLPSSRPASRAPSPVRSRASSAALNIASRASTLDPDDPLNDYFSSSHSYSQPSTPGYAPYSSSLGPETFGRDGTMTPGGTHAGSHQLDIVLDSDHLVLRGQGGDMNPAYLSGHIVLKLNESANIKGITMNLTGKAKVQFTEGNGTGSRNHHYEHRIINHDWSFLEGDKRHTHTLKAGQHSFPFSFTLDGNLPSSVRTFSGDAIIQYKLRATVLRSGFARDFSTARTFSLVRSFTPEALEFNQTLEIENTWPGKIMYAITLPFKAYAAGDEIPVAVKFMPLAKGVRVLSVSSAVKEYSLVHTRNSSHPDSRVAASVKHVIVDGRAVEESRASRDAGGQAGEASGDTSSSSDPDVNVEIGDDEVSTHFSILIPVTTTPSHTLHPVFVTHKIKWSCAISNSDGHVSELRCALPIFILDHSLLDEARAAGAATRALLFGGAAVEEAQQIDLPSYSNHVYDRVAVTDGSGFTRSVNATPHHSPSPTPPQSRSPSRPSSPVRRMSRLNLAEHVPEGLPAGDLPPRPQISAEAENDLYRSLNQLSQTNPSSPAETPPDSRGHSRGTSRGPSRSGSRVGSRAGSRAPSPERERDDRPSGERRGSSFHGLLHLPTFSKGPIKPLSALAHKTPILRSSAGPSGPITRNAVSFTNLPDGASSSRPSVSFAPSAFERPRKFQVDGPGTPTETESNPLSRVPSYNDNDVVPRFVVPLDPSLPTYDDSERQASSTDLASLVRARSDTALVNLGSHAEDDA